MTDFLNTILDQIEDITPEEQRKEWLITRQIEIPQGKGQRHVNPKTGAPISAGVLYVGGSDVSQGTYSEEVDFLLVHAQVNTVFEPDGKYRTVHGRRHRAFEQQGTGYGRSLTEPDWCQSSNGIMPTSKFLGKEVIDIRTGEKHYIGMEPHLVTEELPNTFNADGTPATQTTVTWKPVEKKVLFAGEEYLDVCGACPLAKWNDGRPPCEPAPRYVVFVLPRDGSTGYLATLRAENNGVAQALIGAGKGSQGARHDGEAFVGIAHYFKPNGKTLKKVLPTATLHSKLTQFVKAVSNDAAGTPSVAVNKGDDVTTLLSSYEYAVVEFPTYHYAPQGRPEFTGEFGEVHPVTMSITRNGFVLQGRPNATFVPEFTLNTGRKITEQEYTAYLEAMAEYFNSGTNLSMTRMQDMKAAQEKFAELLAGNSAPQLPATTPNDQANAGVDF